jgi:hypothetical protein
LKGGEQMKVIWFAIEVAISLPKLEKKPFVE